MDKLQQQFSSYCNTFLFWQHFPPFHKFKIVWIALCNGSSNAISDTRIFVTAVHAKPLFTKLSQQADSRGGRLTTDSLRSYYFNRWVVISVLLSQDKKEHDTQTSDWLLLILSTDQPETFLCYSSTNKMNEPKFFSDLKLLLST